MPVAVYMSSLYVHVVERIIFTSENRSYVAPLRWHERLGTTGCPGRILARLRTCPHKLETEYNCFYLVVGLYFFALKCMTAFMWLLKATWSLLNVLIGALWIPLNLYWLRLSRVILIECLFEFAISQKTHETEAASKSADYTRNIACAWHLALRVFNQHTDAYARIYVSWYATRILAR